LLLPLRPEEMYLLKMVRTTFELVNPEHPGASLENLSDHRVIISSCIGVKPKDVIGVDVCKGAFTIC